MVISLNLVNLRQTFETNQIIRFKQSDANLILGESKVKGLRPQLSNIKFVYESRNVLLNERGAIGILSADANTRQKTDL